MHQLERTSLTISKPKRKASCDTRLNRLPHPFGQRVEPAIPTRKSVVICNQLERPVLDPPSRRRLYNYPRFEGASLFDRHVIRSSNASHNAPISNVVLSVGP